MTSIKELPYPVWEAEQEQEQEQLPINNLFFLYLFSFLFTSNFLNLYANDLQLFYHI